MYLFLTTLQTLEDVGLISTTVLSDMVDCTREVYTFVGVGWR